MPNANNALESKIGDHTRRNWNDEGDKMETKEIMEQLRQDWLQKPSLTETELEYLNNYFYDDNYSYCEECDTIDSDDNWFWYDGDKYTDYIHIKCNKDKYEEQ